MDRDKVDCNPSDIALVTGMYSLRNPQGMRTSALVPVFQDSALPVAPQGWTWRLERRELAAA